jgi:hypothetical protein
LNDFFQLFLCGGGTRGVAENFETKKGLEQPLYTNILYTFFPLQYNVLGRTQVDYIGTGIFGVVWEESIVGIAFHVHDLIVLQRAWIDVARLTHHDGRIYVHRVRWILHCRYRIPTKHLLQPHNITFGAV